MQDKIFNEASKYLHTNEGKIIYSQIQNERSKVTEKLATFMSQALTKELDHIEQKKQVENL
jgi:rhamnose utilization protein RhaD (predicted bifunctional aldolase and dehydrogenase)